MSKTGDDTAVVISPSQRQMLLNLVNMVQDNPAQFLDDYADFSLDDIDLFNDLLLNAIMDTHMVSFWKQGVIPNLKGYMATVNSGGVMTFTGGTTLYEGSVWSHTTPAINDKLTYPFLALKAGIWDIRVYYTKDNASGICTVKLNDVTTLLTIDAYAASGTNNNVSTGSFTVSTDDIYTLTLKQASKNASSSGYRFAHNFVFLRRVSD
jgi:hypothetical protein